MKELEEIINYQFKNQDWLREALTHPSFNEGKKGLIDYQRLEFLGDSVLGLIISEILINTYIKDQEGDLANKRAALVCRDTLVKVALKLNLGNFIFIGKSENNANGRNNPATLENSLEALIGAIYLDGGINFVSDFIKKFWHEEISNLTMTPKNFKSMVQEWAQKLKKPIPSYIVISREGLSHKPNFVVKLIVDGEKEVQGQGASKKIAENEAAKNFIETVISHKNLI